MSRVARRYLKLIILSPNSAANTATASDTNATFPIVELTISQLESWRRSLELTVQLTVQLLRPGRITGRRTRRRYERCRARES